MPVLGGYEPERDYAREAGDQNDPDRTKEPVWRASVGENLQKTYSALSGSLSQPSIAFVPRWHLFFFLIPSIIIPTLPISPILLPFTWPLAQMVLRPLIPCFLLLTVFSFQQSPVFSQEIQARGDIHSDLFIRGGGHHHSSHAQPLLELNETEVLLWHAPTPPSYYTIDWEGSQSTDKRYPGLIISHALFMSLAFFIALPMGEFASVVFTQEPGWALQQVSFSVPLSTQVKV